MTLGAHSVGAHPSAELAAVKRAGSAIVTGVAGDITTTTLYTAPSSRMYMVCAEILCTTAGSAGTVTLTIGFTDDVGASTAALGPFTLAATGRTSSAAVIQSKFGTAITYAAARSGVSGSPIYAVYIFVMEVSS